MRKRITSLFLVLALCLTLLPTTALAEEAGAAQETQDSTEVGDGYTIEEDTAVQGKGENDKAVQTVQALIDALPAAEDISDANADEVSGQLDAIDEAKQALTEEQAAQLDFAKYDAAAAAVLALAGEPDANEPAVLADTIGTQPSGSGTAKDPYQITSAAELIWLRAAVNAGEANTCAELQQDVEYVDEVWTPIGTSEYPYTGTFNGNGHTIRVWLDGRGQALFGYVGADAKLTDLAVTKRQSENYSLNASAPLARSNAGTITRCRYSGGMTAKGSLGGLVYTNSGTIEACYVYAGQLNGGSRIEMYNGGLAGGIAYENTGTIVNSYFYGDIVQAQSNGTVRDIIGWGAIAYEKSGGKIINCYYGADSDDGYGGKTEDQFRGGEVAYLLNGGTARDDWRQNRYAGDDTPVLDRSHAQVRKSGDYYVSLYPHVHCICGGGTTSGGHPQHNNVTYTAWTDDEAASQYGASSYTAANSLPKKPGKYYLTSDVTLRDTGTWCPADGTVLCLNGQTVREFAFDTPAYDVITVDSSVTFSLTECASIQGDIHCASSAATHTVNNSGTFNFYNGRLRDTKSKADGAAVYNTGTFNMYGGTINDNNTTARGGGVYNAGACNLYGGTITNNGTGGGVYNNGTLTVGGTATVTGNSPNVYLAGGTTITLNSELDESARIGITAEKQSDLTDTADITVVKGGAAALNCFFPDDDGTYDLSDASGSSDIILHLIRDHTHCACAHKAKYAKDIGSHTKHVDHEFVAWTDELVKEQYGSDTTRTAATAMPKVAGCYYLTDNVTLGGNSAWTPMNGTIICMNGHKVTSPSAIGSTVYIESNVHVVLTDCKASGSISNTRSNGAAGLSSRNSSNYTNSENCTIDLFGVTVSGTGRSVANYTGSTVNLYNSTVSGTKYAIYNTGTVNTAGTVKTTSDTVESGYYCVYNFGTLTVDGTLTANGGDVGIYNAANNDGSQHGTMTVNGIVTSTGSSNGLSNGGVLAVTGTLTAIGKNLHGLYNNEHGTLTVNGTLTAAGNASSNKANGLYNAGGTVTVNGTLTASGGQYSVYNYGTLNLSGTVNANKNVYLGKDRTITVVGELDNATSITVQTSATPAAGSPVTIATTENANWIKAGSFVSWTPSKYAVSRINEGKTVVLRGHEHDWSYTLGSDGTAISAECSNADGLCGNTNGGSVTIAPPSGELIYDGSAKAAKLTKTGWTAADVGEIVYQKDGSALSAVPVDAGTYTASIAVGEGGNAKTASVEYTIEKATPTAENFNITKPGNLTYDGTSKTATVTSTKNGMGAVTVKYFKNGAETEPKDAGDYTVKVSVAEGANYNATTDDLTTDDWKFTIGKATQTITVPTDKTIVKDGIAEDISDWATVAGVTGGSNPGTLSYALNDQAPEGVSLTGNQLTVQLTCTATQFTIKVTAEETGNYNKEEQTFTVKVADKNTATVTITGLPDTVTYGQEFTLTASQTGDTTSANKKWTWDYDREYFKLVGPNANTETITLQAIKAGTPSKGITATYESGTHKGSKTVTPGVAQKEVTVSGITAANKKYDGGTSATVDASTATITGKVDGDDLTVSVAAGSTFDSADVGSRTVTLGTPTLGGTSAVNYTLAATGNQTTATANITVRDLTVKPDSGQRKTFGDADPALTYAYSGEVSGETPVFDGALSRKTGEDVGTYNITKGRLELKDSGTFKAANYNLVLDRAVVTFEITKGTYGGSAPTKTVNILKNYAGVQTGTLTAADFFTTAPAEAKITNAVPNSKPSSMMSLVGADSSGNFTYDSKTNITAASDESWTVTISSKNYTDINATLTFKLVDKTDVSAQITFPNGTLTYNGAGQKYEKATISGVSGGTWNYTYVANSGTGASLDSAGLPKTAGTYTVTAKYEDSASLGTKNAKLTISKATPTGAPTCTKITISGKTLADAPLAIGTIAPAGGTLAWDMAANTVVAANTAYGWTYTPADTANYKALTGSLTPYAVSSGGGGGGGSSAATPSVSDKAAKELKNAKEGSTVTIDMKGETKLPASVTKEIAGKDVTVELDMGGGIVWSFNGLDVPKGGVRLDLGVKTGTKTIPAKVINALTGETTTIQLQLDHNGPFGMSLKLSVDLGKKHDGLYANLYFYNPKSGELEFQSASMISGGKASWAFDHASDYAIVIDKESHEPMTFIDVPDSAYYAEAVNWAVAKKITGGVGNGLFAPNDPCTRAQIVTFLWRAAGSPEPKAMSSFADVSTDAYYAKAVAWAVENGITTGTGDGKFSPDATCTRAQSVTFLFRAIGKLVDSKAEFSDVLTDSYYANAVAWAVENGVTNGIGDGLFGPDNSCTRAQIVTFLFRAYQGK